jgi:hypothetical protein
MTIAVTTRRELIRSTAPAGLFLFAESAFAASDFWSKKPPAQWSSDEIRLLRTKSPWAKKVRGEMEGGLPAPAMEAPAGGGRSPSINAAGLPGRGMAGGDDAGGPARGGAEAPEVVIRWESAQPLRSAARVELPAELRDRYTISVTGLPPRMILLGLPRPAARGREGRGEAPAMPQDPAARQKFEVDTILSETTLTVKGHDPRAADAMLRTTDAQTFLFGFPKQNLPLAATDKEVVFTMKLGPLTIKARFEPKEMMFDGQLAV